MGRVNGLLTFTNLFPNAAMPGHGLFVRDRMRRVAAALGGGESESGAWAWHVVAPVPVVPRPLRRGAFVRWASLPLADDAGGVPLHHPRYRHWPGLSKTRQPGRMAAAARPVVQRIAAGGAWVVDAHYLYPDGVAAARVASELGLPYVLTARGSDVNVLAQDPALAPMIAEAARGAAARFAVSEPLARAFEEVAGGLPVECLRNGVDLERFDDGDREQARRALGLPLDVPIALGVGRLVAGKGFGDAVDALTHDALPGSAHLALVGDGPERDALLRRARERGVAERMILLGSRSGDDVVRAYRAADALVLPSRREGWPNVVTEALACGLPVVAYAVGGIPDILAGGEGVGAAVAPGDPNALAIALSEPLQTPADRSKVRQFATRYSWEAPVQRMAEVLRQIARGR